MSVSGEQHAFTDDQILAVAVRLPSFEEALARLLYLVEHRRPCGLVLGLAGTGKSLLLEALRREVGGSEFSGSSCRPLPINSRSGGGLGFAWTLATRMGLSPGSHARLESLWRSIEDRYQGAAMAGQSIVPIIDHLDQADRAAIADLSRCCHLAVQFGGTVLLSGRPPIGAALGEAVGPICDLRIELPLWTAEETSMFVSRVLEGGPRQIAADAVPAIHTHAGGRMRDTVQVLRLTVFAAQAQGLDEIDAELVQTVAGEIWQPIAAWHRTSAGLPSTATLAAARG